VPPVRGLKQDADEAMEKDEMDSDEDEEEESGDFEVMSAKQTLLHGLERLGDQKTQRYSLTELESFVLDLDNILKVLTFKETVGYVLPALEIFLGEPEYLKVELFRQMPNVFNKLIKSPARISTQDSIDLLTVDIFPLISQIFMTSDSEV